MKSTNILKSLRNESGESLNKKDVKLQTDYEDTRLKISGRKDTSFHKSKVARRSIARVKTILKEKNDE